MKQQLLKFCFIFLISLVAFQAKADHVQGGEITYLKVANNQYKVTVNIYADCGKVMYATEDVYLYSSPTCNFTQSFPLVGAPVNITPTCSGVVSSCVNPGDKKHQKYVYSALVTLPSNCLDWTIHYNFFQRLPSITSISLGSFYISAKIYNSTNITNQSPIFVEDRPLVIGCVNDTVALNYSAYDLDGDSLVYSLMDALIEETVSGVSVPSTNTVNYISSLSGLQPFIGYTSIDSQFGLVTVVPTVTQKSVLVVKVEEYRNGVKVGETFRDLAISIENCGNNTIPKIRSIDSINSINNVIHISIPAHVPYSGYLNIDDPEVVNGTQYTNTYWQHLPNNATGNAGYFQWTPVNSQVGTHYVSIRIEDNNCSILGINSYILAITVTPNNSPNNPPIPNDDYYFVSIDSFLIGDLLLNDSDPNGDSLFINFPNTVGPYNGLHIYNINSTFAYTPLQIGIDSFTYEVCDNGVPSFCTPATAYIMAYTDHNIVENVAAGTTNDICFDVSSLPYPNQIASISTNDSFSNATILTTSIANSCIKIKADSISVDETLFYIFDTSGASITYSVKLTVEQGVWPGDTDTSQIVNNFDLLNIGLGFGNTGTARTNPSILWNGYLTPDWTKVTPVSNINFKHIDCNGDGIIDMQDTVAISNNWNSSYTYNKSGAGIIPLYVDTISTVIKRPTLPIMLGDAKHSC